MKNRLAKRRTTRLIAALVVVVLIGTAVVWLKVVRAHEDPTSGYATFAARRGPLTISVLESGAIKAKDQEVIRCELEGRTSITFVVPEGTYVKKGDLLVELDSSNLEDNRIDQEIRVQNTEASYINSKETLDIIKNQAQSDIEKAELTLIFAKQDLEQYLQGQYPNLVTAAQNKVNEAEEVLARALETLKWSQTLFDEKYISETELMADKLAKTKSENNLTVSKNDLNLLENFTKQRQIDQLTSDVRQAEMALERTTAKGRANVVQAEAELNARKQEYDRQVAKLEKIKDQLGKSKLYAPVEGMVVYATSARSGRWRGDRSPLDDGVEVFERQELIYLPKSASSVAEVDIHEASLEKIRAGLPAVITVDAMPGKKFIGTVARIAPLPDPQSMWMNPDLKVYNTDIDLEGADPALRSGMSCKAEIIVEQYPDVVYVPVQSVIRAGGQPTVYVVKDGTVEARNVEIGLDNNRMVNISSGLNEGEVVLLTPPLKAATVEGGEKLLATGRSDGDDTMAEQINEKLRAANGTETGRGTAEDAEAGQPEGPGLAMERSTSEPEQAAAAGSSERPSDEQMQQMRERWQNMTPEEREKERETMRQRFESMSPEEREQMRQRSSGGRGRTEGRRRGENEAQGPAAEQRTEREE